MVEVKAFEHNGKLYKTQEEALKQELSEGLTYLFLGGDDRHDIMRKIVHKKDVQDKIVSLITRYQETLKEALNGKED